MNVPEWFNAILMSRWSGIPLPDYLELPIEWTARLDEVYYHASKQGVRI